MTAWDIGDIARNSEVALEKSDVTFNESFVAACLTYARVLTDRISAGGTLNTINETIDEVSATGVVWDAGMTNMVGETGLRLGVAVKNISNKLQFDGTGLTRRVQTPGQRHGERREAGIGGDGLLSTSLNEGTSCTQQVAGSASMMVLGNFRSHSFEQDLFSGGLELGLRDVLFVRGGYEYVENADVTWWKGYTLGAGLNIELAGSRESIDYAMAPTDFFADVRFLTVSATLQAARVGGVCSHQVR